MTTYKTVKLTRYMSDPKQTSIDGVDRTAWYLHIVAEGQNMPSEIFVFRHHPTEEFGDIFECISSVVDLYEFPKNKSRFQGDLDNIPFYRTAQLQIVCDSAEEAEEFWKVIQEDVDSLVKNFAASEKLKMVDRATVSEDTQIVNDRPTMSNEHLIELAADPCGMAEVTTANNQSIGTPYEKNLRGWLPVSEVPGTFVEPVPAGATYFYNIDAHKELKALLPLKTPYKNHLVHYEGNKLKYDDVYVITRDTIYWKTFNPEEKTEYGIDGDAPWSLDYIDRQNAGSNVIDMSILIFSE